MLQRPNGSSRRRWGAIRLNPNAADARAHFANGLIFAGHGDEAIKELETAMRLNPHDPGWYLQFLGRAHFTKRRYEAAESAFEGVVTVSPGWPMAWLSLAAAHAGRGKTDEAREEVAKARGISPRLSLEHLVRAWPYKDPAGLDHLGGMLREAGLPE